MLSDDFGQSIQPLPALSKHFSPSAAVDHALTATPAVARPLSTRRDPATTGRNCPLTASTSSTADALHSVSVPASSTTELDSYPASKSDVSGERCQTDSSASVRRLDAASNSVSSNQARTAMDSLWSRRGRVSQPIINVSTSAETTQSLRTGQNDSTNTSFVNQRPLSSSNNVRSMPHRSAFTANSVPLTSSSATVPPATTTNASPLPSSPSFLHSSKAASLQHDSCLVDGGKGVSQFFNTVTDHITAVNQC